MPAISPIVSSKESSTTKTFVTPEVNSNNEAIRFYLICYNVSQLIGWSYLLLQTLGHYLRLDGDTRPLYGKVEWTVMIFQNAALLEVIHAMLGFVKSNIVTTICQVMSRVIIVLGVLMPTPAGPASIGLPLCIFAWGITEIVRYLFYVFSLTNVTSDALQWCRYSMFLALYPIGITGELLCMYAAQSYFGETGKWSSSLPNSNNFIFNFQYYLIFAMLLYIPLSPKLFNHMLSQRKKVLGGSSEKKLKN